MAAAAARTTKALGALSWEQIRSKTAKVLSTAWTAQRLSTGPATSYARLRLFGDTQPKDVRVTLYRDNHAWCPYCEKVWLFLEEKKISYKVGKVTMFCYGKKEPWYKAKVPSGMLPALELDGKLITESDVILQALETKFGVLHRSMMDPGVYRLRQLERKLFSAWCQWLCRPAFSARHEEQNKRNFIAVAQAVDTVLGKVPGSPFFLEKFSIADCVFVPYVERMNASLFYYKGFALRDPAAFPNLARWFNGLETREAYRGMQSDFHTHSHDLPPQMGGCYENGTEKQRKCKRQVDEGPWDTTLGDAKYAAPETARQEAVARVFMHRERVLAVNPLGKRFDQPLRCALTLLLTGQQVVPTETDAVVGLRYLRDRVNVPRDMPMWSGKYFRTALETTAMSCKGAKSQPADIPTRHRQDQNPVKFFGGSAM